MNERLREIAIKAQVEHCISHVRLEEFAELIIKECANVAADHDALDIYEEIREHFGITK